MTIAFTSSSRIYPFNAFNTSADNSSDENALPIFLYSYSMSVPIVRLNSSKALINEGSFSANVAMLSLPRLLKDFVPTNDVPFLLNQTQDGVVSIPKPSLLIIVGSPFCIRAMADLVVPRSMP